MKLKALAAVCALAFSSQVHAAATAPTTLFISGSSALQVTIGQIAANMFVAGTVNTYFDASGNGANYRAYTGTFVSTNADLNAASLGGKPGVVYEMAKGGSLMGILPVAAAANVSGLPSTLVLDLTTCTDTHSIDKNSGGELFNCTGTLPAVPDAGVADVEPALFVGINVPTGSPTVTPAVIGALNTVSTLAQPMGIIETNNIVTSFPSLTSLTKPQVTALMDGTSSDWSYVDTSVTAGPVTVCRRTPGSGTQSSINDFFFGFPCSTGSTSPSTSQGDGSSVYTVIENTSSGALGSCMTAVQNGLDSGYVIDTTSGAISKQAPNGSNLITLPAGGRAIGLMGLDRPAQSNHTPGITGTNGGATTITETYTFAQIDRVQPTVENAVLGAYDVLVNNSWNNRLNTVNGIAPLSGAKLALYNAAKNLSGNSSILGICKTPSVPGVAALANPTTGNYDPTTTGCTVNGVAYSNVLLNPVMRTAKTNSCQNAQQVQ